METDYTLLDLKAIILDPENSAEIKSMALHMAYVMGQHDNQAKRCLELAAKVAA